jgi:DNA-binding CsgD family transcriptional regulator
VVPTQLVFVQDIVDFTSGGAGLPLSIVAEGWTCDRARTEFQRWAIRGKPSETNPMNAALSSLPKRICTHRRIELVPDDVWYRSFVAAELFPTSGVDDTIGSFYRLDDRGHVFSIGIFRARGDMPITPRDRAMIHMLLASITPRYETSLKQARFAQSLPPRLRQTAELLLQGHSEKQVAQSMQLSRHTVHGYIKDLHRRLNVASRGELLLRLVELRDTLNSAGPAAMHLNGTPPPTH